MEERARFCPRVEALGPLPDAGELVARLADFRARIALDSAGGTPRRWSLVAFEPLALGPPPAELGSLRAFHARLEHAGGDDVPGPFHGGFLGALAYDLGVHGERALALPRDAWGTPLVIGGLYVDFLVRDETNGDGWLVLGDAPGDGRAPVRARRERVLAALRAPPLELVPPRPLAALVRHTPPEVHMRRIGALRERIAAGELYQANLAHRFTRSVATTPAALYRRLRAVNPAPYAAFLEWDSRNSAGALGTPRGALLSASPELLLEFDGAVARTRPIKGTIARGKTPAEDAERAARLLASAKDRAELAMIVDLERNDLGRVARAGSVRVEAFPRLETFATVHHLVADVVAEAAPDRDAFDLLAALFPGGSITGAPKLAALRAIAELEGEGRGFFTGAAGFVDTRGRAAFDILIRTLVWRPGSAPDASEVAYHVGGGITWSSDAAEEDAETLAKGAALADALDEAGAGSRRSGREPS
ncbi:MAG: anthranilate synthase component I family protein [Planctomycetes bacterium]|nr:anthranilate synthase component I family protein [Planctomycetota bacterium]